MLKQIAFVILVSMIGSVHATDLSCPKKLKTNMYGLSLSSEDREICLLAEMSDKNGIDWSIEGSLGSMARDNMSYMYNIAKRELLSASLISSEVSEIGDVICHYQTDRGHILTAQKAVVL